MTRLLPYCGMSRISFGIIAAFCFSAFSLFHLAAHLESQATTGRGVLFHSFELHGLLRGLDIDPQLDRFPHEFQIEFLGSIVPRMADSVKLAFTWVQENADDWRCKSSISQLVLDYRKDDFRSNVEKVEAALISQQLRDVLAALSYAVMDQMTLVRNPNTRESECVGMMASARLGTSAVACLLVELPMAIFERDTTFSHGKRFVPTVRTALVPNCSAHTVAGRFLSSMISTLFLLHQRVLIDLPELDVVANRVANGSRVIILASFATVEDYRVDDPTANFPLNLEQSARNHSVEGLLFYTHGKYRPPPTSITPLDLRDVYEWNCRDYLPFARDPDSMCRSLMASELGKRGYSVYNIDPDSAFLKDISRVKGYFGHLAMANYYFSNEEMWLNYSMNVGRMNNFGQWYLETQSPFSVAWSFFVHQLATDILTRSSGPDANIDDILRRYARIQKSDRSDLIAVFGHDTQIGDDQHVFNDFFNFFSQESSARFLRRIIRRDEIVVSESSTAFLDFRILTGQEYAMAVSFCRGYKSNDLVTVHLTTYGERQHKPTCLREQGEWYLDAFNDNAYFKGKFIAFDPIWFEKLPSRFHEDEASRFLVCYALKHKIIPVLPTFRCSWTKAARDGWQLPQRCSWFMRYSFPSDVASYRDHSFLRKIMHLSSENSSFVLRHSEISSLSMQFRSSHVNGSPGSVVVINPTFWLETEWSWLVRDWLTFSHNLMFSFEDLDFLDPSECPPLKENPRYQGCC